MSLASLAARICKKRYGGREGDREGVVLSVKQSLIQISIESNIAIFNSPKFFVGFQGR